MGEARETQGKYEILTKF